MKRARAPKQSELEFPEWGGARAGAGRKRRGFLKRVAHRARARLSNRVPVHVTLRIVDELPSLRSERAHPVVREALKRGSDRLGFRIVHYSAQTNHLHLVCEAEDERALARGLKGLGVRLARALNRLWGRVGALLADRYHVHALATALEVRNALAYVLVNARRHGLVLPGALDPCSSAEVFDGWREVPPPPDGETWLARAGSWLLRVGWRVHGAISVDVRPGPRKRARR
jgi:hypothetical protein